jgi:hypothetical protein
LKKRETHVQSVMTMVEDARVRCHSADELMFTVALIVLCFVCFLYVTLYYIFIGD